MMRRFNCAQNHLNGRSSIAKLRSATMGVLIGLVVPAAYAGSYLQFLHNNSGEAVEIGAKVPAGWVDIPNYPIVVAPHHSVFDVKYYDKAYYKLCRKKISNVAVPPGGGCGSGTHMYIHVGTTSYHVYDCQWKIHLEKKVNGNWVKHGGELDIKGATFLWSAVVSKDGDLSIHGEKTDVSWGDEYK